MKKFLLLCGFLLVMTESGTKAQNMPGNFVRTYTFCNEQGANVVNTAYFDAIGRKYQELRAGASTGGTDLVTHFEYDASGRESAAWMPVRGRNSGAPVTIENVQSEAASLYGDSQAFTLTKYTPGISNRVSAVCGPGSLWHYQEKYARTEYTSCSNQRNDSLYCRKYLVSGATLKKQGNYSSAGLYVEKHFDEDGHVNFVFKDSRRQVLLERSYDSNSGTSLDTYYVYDAHGNLCWVLPPAASDLLGADGTYLSDTEAIARYGFIYRYDEQQRMTERKLPGCEPEYLVNDKAGRPVLVQNGNLRAEGKWRYTYYTAFGEVAETGICSLSSPLSTDALRAQVGGIYAKATYASGAGYTYSPLPVTARTPELVNYYDTFNFLSLPGFSGDAALTACPTDCRGKLTGSMTGVYGSNMKLYSVFHYDVKGQQVKSVSTNLLGGHETVNTAYTFTGLPSRLEKIHSIAPAEAVSEVYLYSYDNWGKLMKTEHQFDGRTETLSEQTYDAAERLSRKTLGSNLESLTYQYNVRGWLTGIQSGKFAQTLHYTDGVGTPCYNGNISSMTWKSASESVVRGYKLSYDKLNRLTTAMYGETANINTNLDRFTEKVTGYDKNGNITTLQRYGQTGASTYGLIDNLTYTLTGNQLNRVDDAVTAAAYNGGFEFKDGVKQANEYAYDANGNLTKDLNKGITQIQYNVLNLPSVITFDAGNSITYTYAADGTKLRTVHKTGATTVTTDYCGNVIYENGVAKQLLTEEGYVSLNDGQYHYYLKDHQGNNRVIINSSGKLEETNHYYPFGGVFANAGNVQPYKYNGKEYDSKKGLNWYDYGARHYDATLGRFTTMDPMAEKYYAASPYAYCLNNPMRFWDPDGKAPQDPPTGVGFHYWSREKQIRVANIIQPMNAAGNRVFKGTGISMSASAWSVGGNIGVGSVKSKLSLGVVNVSAKTDGVGVSTAASLGEATGEISVGSASAKAGITIVEGKANIAEKDAGLSFNAVSADAKVQVGNNPSAKVDDQGRISAGVKAGPVKVNASFSLQAAGEWFGGVVKLISELLSPEIRIDTRKN